MHRIASAEQHQSARLHRQNPRLQSALQYGVDTVVIHLISICIAQAFHIFETASCIGLLDQQGDGEGRVVKMPAKFLTPVGIVNVDGRQRISVGVQLGLAGYAGHEISEGSVIIERAKRRCRRNHIVADAAFGRDNLAICGVIFGIGRIIRG